jgi:hypothetical protein
LRSRPDKPVDDRDRAAACKWQRLRYEFRALMGRSENSARFGALLFVFTFREPSVPETQLDRTLRQRSALLVRTPGQFRRSRSPPDDPHSAAPRGPHSRQKKLMSVRNRTNRCALHGRAWGSGQCKFRILPPTGRHLPSPLNDRFLGRGGESIDCDRPGLHGSGR